MTRRILNRPWRLAALASLALLCSPPARGDMEFGGAPMPIAQAAGKPGSYRVTMAERSPLSVPAQIVKRMHIPGLPAEGYEWDKEIYDLYVPKEPGEGGKYGLMVGAVFKDFGAPPGDWGDALDKHHVIWICSETVGDGQPDLRRIGTMLDAAHNVRKFFQIQDDRTYASMGGWRGAMAGVHLHYADVFDGGALMTVGWGWFAKLKVPQQNSYWNPTEGMTRPDAEQVALARRARYFFVKRAEEIQSDGGFDTDIIKFGYPSQGITSVKMITVTRAQMGHYGQYDPIIFEQAITFLDAPISKLPPKLAAKPAAPVPAPPPPASPSAEAKPAPPAAPAAPAASGNDSAKEANKALGMAKNYIALQKYEAARPKLQKVIETYPGTPAAKEAKALLVEIDGK